MMWFRKWSVIASLAGLVVFSSIGGQQADHAIEPPGPPLVPPPLVPPPLVPPPLSPGSQTRVHYSDIPGRVLILGKLGQPLGQLVTVRGRWEAPFFPSKPALPEFLVNQVDGRPLDPPARFDRVEPVWEENGEVAKRTDGEEWELRGVETGGFVGFSDQVWEELGIQKRQHAARGFLTRFGYVKATRVPVSKSAR